jgi:hypothetical protein
VTFICFSLGIASYLILGILFPYTVLILGNWPVHSDLGLILPAIIQFPIYGIILGFANAKRKLILAACVLLAIHLSAIGLIFMPSDIFLDATSRKLIQAVDHDDVQTVKSLLDSGGDPSTHELGGYSLLEMASNNGRVEMVKLLLEKGADINYRDRSFGQTALLLAVQRGRWEIVPLLLSRGADVTIKDSYGLTALDRAKGQQESQIKHNNQFPGTYPDSERARDDKIIALLESAAKDQKRP